jgi:acetyl-CoA acetyltransferase
MSNAPTDQLARLFAKAIASVTKDIDLIERGEGAHAAFAADLPQLREERAMYLRQLAQLDADAPV